MGAYNGGVDHHVFIVMIAGQQIENALENPVLCPSTETLMNRFPVAETLRQITPGTPGSKSVENGLDEQSIIVRRAAHMSLTPGQKILDPIPLIVA
jgi:hypothetical protein